MKILVTGSAGRIGRQVVPALRAAGHEVRTFDKVASREADHLPGTVLDPMRVREAVQGCDGIAHLAAIPSDFHGKADEIMATNVQGTWHVLQAAAEAGVTRVVHFSSIQALGFTATQQRPDYLPMDDEHPRRPLRPYSLSKNLGEDICRYFTESADITTICLRPAYVTDPDAYAHWGARIGRGMRWLGYMASDFWAYVDVQDVADAVVLGLAVEGKVHARCLLAADDTSSTKPTAELLAEHYPDVPLRLPESALADNPFHGLIDTRAAREVLGWRPKRSWRDVISVGE